ncbi:MAG: hypothetical protein Q8L85_05975 [Alphaproteobacteria bacterium]|nr:hypothetical protein [Alphaproteobacteria bacterium]
MLNFKKNFVFMLLACWLCINNSNAENIKSGILGQGVNEDTIKSFLVDEADTYSNLFRDVPHNNRGKINPNCLNIIPTEEGAASEGIFLVQLNQNCVNNAMPDEWKIKYVIKIINEDGKNEIKNLKFVQQSDLFRQISSPENKDLPLVALALEPFYTFEKDGRIKYLIIQKAAKGKDLYKIVMDDSPEQVRDAFTEFGRSTAKMHLLNMKKNTLLSKLNPSIIEIEPGRAYRTFIHGDSHLQNIFFDAASNRITMIDTESFIKSMHPDVEQSVYAEIAGSIYWDLLNIFYKSVRGFKFLDNEHATNLQRVNVRIAYESFFSAYIKAFPETERKFIYQYINYLLQDRLKSEVPGDNKIPADQKDRFKRLLENVANYLDLNKNDIMAGDNSASVIVNNNNRSAAPVIANANGLPSDFDALTYLNRYPDLVNASRNLPQNDKLDWAKNHYLNHGKKEGRQYTKPLPAANNAPVVPNSNRPAAPVANSNNRPAAPAIAAAPRFFYPALGGKKFE